MFRGLKRWDPLSFARLTHDRDEVSSPLRSPTHRGAMLHGGSHRTVYINDSRASAHQHYKVRGQQANILFSSHSPSRLSFKHQYHV